MLKFHWFEFDLKHCIDFNVFISYPKWIPFNEKGTSCSRRKKKNITNRIQEIKADYMPFIRLHAANWKLHKYDDKIKSLQLSKWDNKFQS